MARIWTSTCAIAGFVVLGVTMVSSAASGNGGPTPGEDDRRRPLSTDQPWPGTELRPGVVHRSGKPECRSVGRIRVKVGKVGTGNRVGGRSEGSFQAGKVTIGGKVIDAKPGKTVDVRVPGRCAPAPKSAPVQPTVTPKSR